MSVDKLEDKTAYKLIWHTDDGQEFLASEEIFKSEGRSRFSSDTCFKTISDMELDREDSIRENSRQRLFSDSIRFNPFDDVSRAGPNDPSVSSQGYETNCLPIFHHFVSPQSFF